MSAPRPLTDAERLARVHAERSVAAGAHAGFLFAAWGSALDCAAAPEVVERLRRLHERARDNANVQAHIVASYVLEGSR